MYYLTLLVYQDMIYEYLHRFLLHIKYESGHRQNKPVSVL